MKLNKKGYMLVEIVIASVLAMSIAYYLLNLTYKFKNNNEDIYQSYLYTKDKNLITKNIMNDLERGTVSDIISYSDYITFDIYITGSTEAEHRKLMLTKSNGKTTIFYGKTIDEVYDKSDISYYEKTLETSLLVGDLSITDNDNRDLAITIPLNSIYSDHDYSIKLFAQATPRPA